MSSDELGEMTPRNFQNKLKGYSKKVEQDRFFHRQMAYYQIASWGSKIKPNQMFPLSIDERVGTRADIPTKEETEAVIREFKKVNPKLFRPSGR